MKMALKRFFLILFPLSLTALAIVLTHKKKPITNQLLVKNTHEMRTHPFNSNCPFYYGFSFFSFKEHRRKPSQKIEKTNQASFFPFLSNQDFLNKIQELKKELKKYSLSINKILFEIPITLTKDQQWLISQKSFFILSTGERKEISQLNYSELKLYLKNKTLFPIKLAFLLPHFFKNPVLFSIKGNNQKLIVKNLQNPIFKNLKKEVFVSSTHEKILKHELSNQEWIRIHSFKSLIQFQLMKTFHLNSWKSFPGEGFLIPTVFTPFIKDMNLLKKQKKLLILKKDPPYQALTPQILDNLNGLISSQAKPVLKLIKKEKPCFILK